MKIVKIHYGVTFGKGDSSDWIDYDLTLSDEEEAFYDDAVANDIPLEDVPELQDALKRAYDEIEEMEIQTGLDIEDEYVMECQGVAPMEQDELNDLIAARDPHALAFFGLTDASEEELDEWDAYDLVDDEIPTIAEFKEDFEPYSPYEAGWSLYVEFAEPEEIEEEEPIEWDAYCDYPFAMEVVNGEIISLTATYQNAIKEMLLANLDISEEDLIDYLMALSEDAESDDDRFVPIVDCEYEALCEALGYDEDGQKFTPSGIGFLGSSFGWEIKQLLECLNAPLEENLEYGPHGHGTTGVIFIS